MPDKVSAPVVKTNWPPPLITPIKVSLALVRVKILLPNMTLPVGSVPPKLTIEVLPVAPDTFNVPLTITCVEAARLPLPFKASVLPRLMVVLPV